METSEFDALTQSLAKCRSRRGITRLLGGLVLGAPLALAGAGEAAATCKKQCGPCKRCKQGKCKPKPAGTACPGGACQRGACVASAPAVACFCPVGKSC